MNGMTIGSIRPRLGLQLERPEKSNEREVEDAVGEEGRGAVACTEAKGVDVVPRVGFVDGVEPAVGVECFWVREYGGV